MTQLAIKGHKTRGKEVIEILEMLGGKNEQGHNGNNPKVAYYICDDNIIRCDCVPNIYPNIYKCVDYTLEEFLEKYPYKVGDKVTLDKWPCTITGMSWEYDDIIYYVQGSDFSKGVYSKDKDLQPYKEYNEETVEERKYADLRLDVDQDDKLATEATIDGNKITPPENYLIGKITQVDNGMLVEFVKKQPQYPKTYEECCRIMGFNSNTLKWNNFFNINKDTHPYIKHFDNLIESFCKLLICRDAYWKIIGEQWGWDNPWKPIYTDNNIKYNITTHRNELDFNCTIERNYVLLFPTEEIRSTFYENFKKLIEQCKELL